MIAHEYFHNWTGDRITCRDWFQLCLKEGLTVFRDQEFTADQRSRAVERIGDVRALRSHQFVEDAGPLAHPVRPEIYHEINNFYTTTVYDKGAEVVRMIKALLGPGLFRKGMDLYFTRHDGQAATVEQFVQCFADVSGRDMKQFMRWYSQAGTPEVVVTPKYDARAHTYRLDIAQTIPPTPGQPTKEPMVIPLAVGLIGNDGRDLPLVLDGRPLHHGVLELTQPSQSFVFTDVAERPIPSLNRGFSAPIKLSLPIEGNDLRFLAAHDRDPFNRWQAVQSLAMSLLTANVAALRSGAATRDDDGLMAALGAILEDAKLEPAFIALTLAPPSEADLAREIGCDVDPNAVFMARRKLRAAIGERLAAALANTYERMNTGAQYRPDAQGAGRRSLKNVCLDLLATTERGEAIARAVSQYETADNMTDRMAALETLSLLDRPERTAALDDFYRRYADDPADHRQVAGAAGRNPRAGNARTGACADLSPRVFDGQSQPGAFADRLICAGQSHPVQSRRRRRLRLRRRYRARARPEESAGGGAYHGCVPLLARARGAAPAPCGSDLTPGRVDAVPVARRGRHRCPHPGR